MIIHKQYLDQDGVVICEDIELELNETKENVIDRERKFFPNCTFNFIVKEHVNQYDNIYLHRGNFDKTKDIYIPKIRYVKNPTKTILEKSVQCSGFSVEGYRCLHKTKKANGLCHFHQNPNVTVKYWKN